MSVVIEFHVTSELSKHKHKLDANAKRLLSAIGRDVVASAKRSIQKKQNPAAIRRPPRDVTGKLKAGIDFSVRGWVLYTKVKAAATNPPPGSPKRRNVPKWLEDRHPFLKPALLRILGQIRKYIARYPLTRI